MKLLQERIEAAFNESNQQIADLAAKLEAMTQERDDATEVSKAWVQKCIDYEHELVSDHGGHVGLRDKFAASEQRVMELEMRIAELHKRDDIWQENAEELLCILNGTKKSKQVSEIHNAEVADRLERLHNQLTEAQVTIARLEKGYADQCQVVARREAGFQASIDQLQATITAQQEEVRRLKDTQGYNEKFAQVLAEQQEEIRRLRELIQNRRLTIEASIAAEVLAGNTVKESIERAALTEVSIMEQALASGKETT